MAECHPVGFQWVMEARERGATIIHVDPRFTRTSALADIHVPLRAGSDIAFLGGIINHILTNNRWFREYVLEYTNAATLIDERFQDTEDLDGVFSGFEPESGTYDTVSWRYDQKREDRTLQDPRCVFQLLRRHYARYTPQLVEDVCGVPQDLFLRVAGALCDNSGPERTSAFCYAVGWTQHTVGVQYIRTAAIIQALLGNIGRPGGGILALRGHTSIQGSTDIPTLYNLLPGYIPMPRAEDKGKGLGHFVDVNTPRAGFWGHMDAYVVSLLRAWYGDASTRDNEWAFANLPLIDADHSEYTFTRRMLEGGVKGYFLAGENPAVGSSNSRYHRLALAKLDWLVSLDLVETESAAFWKNAPELQTGELRTGDIATEVFFMPAAAHTEKDGSFTNTQRLLQWHHAAHEPHGDRRSDLWFFYHLGRRIKEKLKDSTEPRDRALRELTWSYATQGTIDEPSAEAVLAEINGWGAGHEPLSMYTDLRANGSTACGCWIYCGSYADGVNQTARRKPHWEQGTWPAREWGWAWPDNRRILYNRASADPDGKPWSERKRYVWWDDSEQAWTGVDKPDFRATTAPSYIPPPEARAELAIGGREPFVMQPDGKAWLFVPAGLKDGPMPTHYEPRESPVGNALYTTYPTNPTTQIIESPLSPLAPTDGVYPYVATTYRLTEHHTAGAMSRTLAYLSELQPEFFCEVSPALARERRLDHGGWATIISPRSAIEARVLVTDRVPVLRVRGRVVHTIGLPYHWGSVGLSTGDSANDIFHLALDPNVHIQEVKAALCDIRAGRRPRGASLIELVNDYRKRAGIETLETRA